MKIVLIGGGSFVFAPSVLVDAIVKHRVAGSLYLVDLNLEAAEAMAGAGRRMAAELGVPLRIEACTDRRDALPGADYVIVSASPQGAKRWRMDYEILSELGMPDQARECGGVGGLMNALRSITLVLDICKDMEELCPDAMLLDVTNPMPRVVTAVERFTKVRCAGFCNIAHRDPNGYAFIARLLGKQQSEVEIVTAGLNHLAWVLSAKDKQTGEDLLPGLIRYIDRGEWGDQEIHMHRELSVMRRWLHTYGAVAAGFVDHHAEYLPLQEDIYYATTPPYHGTEAERGQRLLELKEIAEGSRDWRVLLEHGSWEHPIDLAILLQERHSAKLDILNVRNGEALPQLPADRIVEVPVTVRDGELTPTSVPPLPPQLAGLLRAVSDVHELAAEAAAKGDPAVARQAIELDPAVTDKKAAYTALERMLRVHSDMLPQFRLDE